MHAEHGEGRGAFRVGGLCRGKESKGGGAYVSSGKLASLLATYGHNKNAFGLHCPGRPNVSFGSNSPQLQEAPGYPRSRVTPADTFVRA